MSVVERKECIFALYNKCAFSSNPIHLHLHTDSLHYIYDDGCLCVKGLSYFQLSQVIGNENVNGKECCWFGFDPYTHSAW
jgi:hypothetical protein